jgi:N4-gp56 family major capsid protein
MASPGPLSTTTAVGVPFVTNSFMQVMLARGIPYLHYGRAALRKPLKQKSGTTAVFGKLAALSQNTTPLVEGITPTGKQLSASSVTSVLKQYGDFLTITDYFELTVEDPVLGDASRALGEQAGQSIDTVFGNAAIVGTSVSYGGAVASRSLVVGTGQKIDVNALRRAIRTLRNNNARPFTRLISALDAYDTHPVREAFWAVTSPQVHFTLNTLPGWISVANYPSQDGVLPGEVGSFEDIRFLVSTNAIRFTGATDSGATWDSSDVQNDATYTDVHTILIFGQGAFGIVPLDGMSFENIIHASDQGGPSNPLNQYGTMAWKRNGTQVILDDNFMTRIEVAVGNNAP